MLVRLYLLLVCPNSSFHCSSFSSSCFIFFNSTFFLLFISPYHPFSLSHPNPSLMHHSSLTPPFIHLLSILPSFSSLPTFMFSVFSCNSSSFLFSIFVNLFYLPFVPSSSFLFLIIVFFLSIFFPLLFHLILDSSSLSILLISSSVSHPPPPPTFYPLLPITGLVPQDCLETLNANCFIMCMGVMLLAQSCPWPKEKLGGRGASVCWSSGGLTVFLGRMDWILYGWLSHFRAICL